jgi:hypothetical protein
MRATSLDRPVAILTFEGVGEEFIESSPFHTVLCGPDQSRGWR